MNTETDRELLECAAKAAGYELIWGEKYNVGDRVVDCTDMSYIRSEDSDVGDVYWNPLTDDCDALRLAVKLGMGVIQWTNGVSTTLAKLNREFAEPWGDDPYAATRRAIVRAAAAIGKAMP